MASTRPASRRLTRPSTAFCSWITLGIFRPGRGQQRGQRRIAAEADHGGRLEAFEQAQRHARPSRIARSPRSQFSGFALSRPRAGHARSALRACRGCRAALVGDQRDMVAAPLQFAASAKAGIRCPPVPPGGEHEVPADRAHRPTLQFPSMSRRKSARG
jgi:hypothetical protein